MLRAMEIYRLPLLAFVVLSLSCLGSKTNVDGEGDADTDSDSDSDSDADSDADTDTDNYVEGESPEVLAVASADCGPDPDDVDLWSVSVTVTDPQGADTLSSMDSTVSVVYEDNTLASYAMACGTGTCFGSWQANDDNIDCDLGYDSIFRFIIIDEEGYESLPFEYQPE